MRTIKVEIPARGRSGLYVTVGVWRKREKIELAFPGKKIHAQINNRPGTSRYQPHLYEILKGLLEQYGRWGVPDSSK